MSIADKPAFPELVTDFAETETGKHYADTYSHGGLTKREYFASTKMDAIISNADTMREITAAIAKKRLDGDKIFSTVARLGLEYADALIESLEK